MKNILVLSIVALLVIAASSTSACATCGCSSSPKVTKVAPTTNVDSAAVSSPAAQAQEYTCSMHPQVIKPKPGKCPICGMNLSPVPPKAEATAVKSAPTAATICLKCGQIKGSETCCKQGVEKCTKCGLAKGSPGCCKLAKDPSQEPAKEAVTE